MKDSIFRNKENGKRTDSTKLRKAMLREDWDYRCAHCGISSWLNKPLVLHVDHINSDKSDNRRCNLQFLCPNCHSRKTENDRIFWS